MNVSLVDRNFKGDLSACHGRKPTYFTWDRTDTCNSKYRFITDLRLHEPLNNDKINVAWLLEPRDVFPRVYEYVEKHHDKFDYVLTYDEKLLSINKTKFLESIWSTSWLYEYSPVEAFSYKTKNVSMIASDKKRTYGHKLRHDIIEKLDLCNSIDVYGPTYKNLDNSIPHKRGKVKAINDYRFNIAMENSQQAGYFSEKIVDCFATKTVPIYWGDSTIGKHFNTDGIIFFNNAEELSKILNTLNEDTYNSMAYAIEDNYNRCKDSSYIVPEDYIYYNYRFLLR